MQLSPMELVECTTTSTDADVRHVKLENQDSDPDRYTNMGIRDSIM